ncbi:hypothetical protein CONLIGDRAFT_704286 [Coniochaeta ligniaria NRRL 30616]|uniref:Uncharacterized protein n=1 Tax=Coniochaeta ligniaria NRRL 30616 TaxID=1408157 RepID=A0A1J7IND5_9PEZI|nr:hypothetical protein CONLIGDRAFT_704286 [Coniochaeta ligniaria NRRL 30616]
MPLSGQIDPGEINPIKPSQRRRSTSPIFEQDREDPVSAEVQPVPRDGSFATPEVGALGPWSRVMSTVCHHARYNAIFRLNIKSVMEIDGSFDASIMFEKLLSSLQYLHGQDTSQNITDDVVSILRRWLSQPLLVSDSDILKILRFEESHKDSPPLTSGVVCYFRSWSVPMWQFKAIIEDLSSQGQPEEDINGWRDALRSGFDDQSVITVRYVGRTCAPNNPWRRYLCKPPRPNSLLGAFLTTIHRLFPEAAKSHRIFSITRSCIPDLSTGNQQSARLYRKAFQTLGDLSERAWIGFFWLSDPAEQTARRESGQIVRHVNGLFEDWWDGTRRSVWKDIDRAASATYQPYIDSTIQQAVAKQINGTSIVAICGLEPPWQTVMDGSHLLSGNRATGEFIRNILLSMAQLEENAEADHSSLKTFEDLISFNQLYNWPNVEAQQRQPSRGSINSWLASVKPLVVATLGNKVAGWVCNQQVKPLQNCLAEAGVARIVIAPAEHPTTIVIPHLHPGFNARTSQSLAQLKVYWYSWVATWVHIDVAVRMLRFPRTTTTDRLDLCREVIDNATAILEGTEFFSVFSALKNQVSLEWSSSDLRRITTISATPSDESLLRE